MAIFHIKVIKDNSNELEIEFSERFFRKVDKEDKENLRALEDEGWLKGDEKGLLYKEMSSKELAEALKVELSNSGIDAYTHEQHPLIPSYILHVSAKNPKKELKKSLRKVEKNWNEFKALLEKKLK